MDYSANPTAFSRPAAAVVVVGGGGDSNNTTDSDRDSPTASSDFPATPKGTKGGDHHPAFVTPSPTTATATRPNNTLGTAAVVLANNNSSRSRLLQENAPPQPPATTATATMMSRRSVLPNNKTTVVDHAQDKAPAAVLNWWEKDGTAVSVDVDELQRQRSEDSDRIIIRNKTHQQQTDDSKKTPTVATASVAVAAKSATTAAAPLAVVSRANGDDEKAQARQARMAALAQQPRQPRRRGGPGTPDVSTSAHGLAPPPRRSDSRVGNAANNNTASNSNKNQEDRDVMAKRRGRRSVMTGGNNHVRKLHPPTTTTTTETTLLARRSTTMSSVSTTSSNSTAVTQNTMAQAAAAQQIHAVNLVLESDSDDDDDDDGKRNGRMSDVQAKRRARLSATATAKKLQPRARRHPTTTTGIATGTRTEEVDAAVKRNANMTPAEMAGRSRRRRATGVGLTTSPNNTGGGGSGSGNKLDHSNSTAASDNTTASSVGAHSVTGGRRASKKETGDDDEDGDEDAVQEYLSSVASSQAHDQHLQSVPNNTTSEEDDDAETKMAARGSMRSIVEEDNEDFEFDDDAEFANAGPDEGFVEAEAGVPIGVQVGAFAVDGMDMDGSGRDDFDDAFDSDINHNDTELGREASVAFSQSSQNDPTLTDPNSAVFYDEELALEAELYDNNASPQFLEAELHVVVDAQPLVMDPEGLSAKALRRLRMMQCTVFCLAIGAIAAVVGVAMSRPESSVLNPWQVVIPTIQGWNQVGNNLTGPTDADKSLYGYSVASTGQADRIAIGVPGRDQSATELLVGEVHIMDWNGTHWLPNGAPILGPGPDAQAGTAVAMSTDGKRVAVGSPFFANGGQVAVYEEVQPKEWVMVGQALAGNSSKDRDERFGGSMVMSEDGTTLAVGAAMGEGNNGTDSGYVKVFQLQPVVQAQNSSLAHRWVQMGDTILGENSGDFFGWSLAMSTSGTRIVAGGVGSTGGGVGEFSGHVRVFDFSEDSSTWVQSGQSIPGLATFDSFGSSVAMSASGDIIAVGAIGHSNEQEGVDIGHVRIFQYDAEDDIQYDAAEDDTLESPWKPLGQTLVGQSAFDSFGYSVSLSDDGKTIAIGGPRNDEFAESSGHIQIFELDDVMSSWARRGSNIGGSYEGRDLFGWSVALSANGTRVVGGAPFSAFDGRLNDVGTVRIYDVV